jgi:UDP-2,3-diacylglucosamine hydrolase
MKQNKPTASVFDTNSIQIASLENNKKIFFASDIHFPLHGNGSVVNDAHREEKILAWLDCIKPAAQALFLLGDVFDFWFEYQYLVPKGALRFQAKLLEFYQAKIPVYFFLGNHDIWALNYFTTFFGLHVFRKPASISICNQRFLVGHGDNLNPTKGYAVWLRLYSNPFLQSMVRLIPADWLYRLVHSHLRRKAARVKTKSLSLEPEDPIFLCCKETIEPFFPHNFYIFGHTHMPCMQKISHSSQYCNTGDWVSHSTYAYFDGSTLELLAF